MKETDQNTKQLEPLEQLFEAAQQNDVEKVQSLLTAQPELANMENKDGLTPLGYAAHFGSTESVHALIKHGADVNAVSLPYLLHSCNTALHAALAGERSVEVIKLLLEHGASTSILDSDGQQALHTAAFHTDQVTMIDLLLEYGADAKACNTSGETAREIAQQRGHASVAARLEQAIAKLS